VIIEDDEEDDPTNDVYHVNYDPIMETYEILAKGLSNHSQIDIVSASASYDEPTLTLTMTVAEEIDNAYYAEYHVLYGVQGELEYHTIQYLPHSDTATHMSIGISGTFDGNIKNALSSDKKTISVSFEIPEKPKQKYTVWGYVQLFSSKEDMINRAQNRFMDFVPASNEPDYDGSSNQNGASGTPGFEIITLIAAFAIAVIILRKRR
jgi:hypothetical protein